MLFKRTKPLDLILETASKRSLTRQLGAFDLTMLGIGAVIGTGIFVLTSVAANKAGPGMMYSFIIAGIVCALTALIYSEIAAMVPVSGSAYTYSYAVLGEVVANTPVALVQTPQGPKPVMVQLQPRNGVGAVRSADYSPQSLKTHLMDKMN